MKTTSQRWARIQELFGHALELEASARSSYLNEQCGDDASLRTEVEELLEADKALHGASPTFNASSLLTRSVTQAIEATNRDRRQELIGLIVGSYRLTSVLGHGGAGTVYLGERADRQYSAQVAVKIVENALINDEVARRFQAERQILANLNHPHISRLLDAGETLHGQPYLVMEYVHGDPIDRYCDTHKLTIRQRLELFVKVCAAVQFAHQNLVVHRDLKPGNILVTPDGTPKLLDFGIAKLLDASAQAVAEEAMTRVNDRVLTPEYASPEQILGLNITTTSDVYALGIVLYELLTGTRPYQVSAVSQLELERSICLVDPPRPSLMLGQLPQSTGRALDLTTIANARDVTPKRLKNQLDGDLDAISMRALRKEPELRYRSVEQLVEDIQRHLDQEPVLARQGNWMYYSRRFVRRHTVGVATSLAAVVALVGVAVIMAIQAQRIATQRDRANQERAVAQSVSDFMLEVFTAADPFTAQGREVTAKELLDKAGQRIAGDLNQQPAVRARLLEAIGSSYRRQGDALTSLKFLEDAVKIQRTLPNNPEGLVGALISYGRALMRRDDVANATAAFDEAQQLLEKSNKKNTKQYLTTLSLKVHLMLNSGKIREAEEQLNTNLALAKSVFGNTHPETALVLLQMSYNYINQANLKQAERTLREAIAVCEATLPERHPDRIETNRALGYLLFLMGRLEEAKKILEKTVVDMTTVYGEDNPYTSNALDNLGSVLYGLKEWERAEELQRRALNIAIKYSGPVDLATIRTGLADILLRRGKYKESEQQLTQALSSLRNVVPADNAFVTSTEYFLAAVYVQTNRAKQAEKLLRNGIELMRGTKQEAWRIARSESMLGMALFKLGKKKEAMALLEQAYKVMSSPESAAPKQYTETAKENLDIVRHATGKR